MSHWNDDDLYIIAEIGGNHEGDFEYAKELTHLACQSKAQSIKYQVYTGDTLVSPVESPTRNKHFKKFELSRTQFEELAEMCKSYDKNFSVSVWDPDSVDWIDDLVTFYKVGSGDLNCLPVIEKFIKKRKPIIISTGLSTEEEVVKTVDFIQQADDFYKDPQNLAVLQCNSMYPSPDHDINLNVVTRFQELFPEATIGYSDHSRGSIAAKASVALGAKILEVHFTDSREGKTFRDHIVSLTKDEIDDLYDDGRRIQQMLGDSLKQPTQSETEVDHPVSFRRAVYFKEDLPKGHVVQLEDMCYLRPCHGIESFRWRELVGKTLLVDQPALTRIDIKNLE